MCSNNMFLYHLGKIRVIDIPDCLDSAGVDISKDDCSSRDNVRVVRGDHPCRIYSKTVFAWFKIEECRPLPSIYTCYMDLAPFIGVSLAIVCDDREFNVVKFKRCNKVIGLLYSKVDLEGRLFVRASIQ